MQTIKIHKADGHEPIADIQIEISRNIPDRSQRIGDIGSRKLADIYTQDALKIYCALMKALPGGTRARLATLLLRQWTEDCVFIIPGIQERPQEAGKINDTLRPEGQRSDESETLIRAFIKGILNDATEEAFRRAMYLIRALDEPERQTLGQYLRSEDDEPPVLISHGEGTKDGSPSAG